MERRESDCDTVKVVAAVNCKASLAEVVNRNIISQAPSRVRPPGFGVRVVILLVDDVPQMVQGGNKIRQLLICGILGEWLFFTRWPE
jgi:hypothetical protein